MENSKILLKIRLLTLFFMTALVVSGVTAFPLETELCLATQFLGIDTTLSVNNYNGFQKWIAFVYQGVSQTNAQFPFLAYGTDWLAFAHIIIAAAFIGFYREPLRNKWLLTWGIIACSAIIPLAVVCGAIRQIPFYWRLIDCSFGIFGVIPLLWMKRLVKVLE
ncbi:MAG: hypothetical protein LBN23_06435 [Paludibacter sp.]|jgi:hypothetical protein|nr:hypothetical protein [Paludibacter sp.]